MNYVRVWKSRKSLSGSLVVVIISQMLGVEIGAGKVWAASFVIMNDWN